MGKLSTLGWVIEIATRLALSALMAAVLGLTVCYLARLGTGWVVLFLAGLVCVWVVIRE